MNTQTYKIKQYCWIAADRRNELVRSATVGPCASANDALDLFAADEHQTFTRAATQDCHGWIAYVSNLGHVFMVKV